MRDVGCCDRGTTAKLIEKDLAATGSANNLAAIGPHQAGHGGRGREVNRLLHIRCTISTTAKTSQRFAASNSAVNVLTLL